MRYRSFRIVEYRGIQDPIEFDLRKESIFPLVGVNECGKTTILEALLAFDHTADRQNGGRYLKDVENLYSLKSGDPRVSAEIEMEASELLAYVRKQRKH
ncbi:MAG: AAA family ATPase, partial [Planctomycetota bacterium]